MESAETAAQLAVLRAKKQAGEKLTQEEQALAIRLIRADRATAAVVSAKSKAAKAPANPAATLDKLKLLLGKK